MTHATYTARDGGLWNLDHSCPPIPMRRFDWYAVHDDFDGAPDSGDTRYVHAATREECIAEIERYVEEHAPAAQGDRR